MNFALGVRPLGIRPLAGIIGRGGAVVVASFPVIDKVFTAWLYDSSGQVTSQLSSEIFRNPVTSLEFEINENGCGAFKLVMPKKSPVSLASTQRVDISLFGSQVPWYSGYVLKVPKPGSTNSTTETSGYGYFQKLDKMIVSKTYENKEVSAAVTDLVQTVINIKEPAIGYRASKIMATDYILEKLVFDYGYAKDAFKTLAEFAGDYVYGVDELREVFFKPRNTTINESSRFWVGQHLHEFAPDENSGDVVNFFYVRCGNLDDATATNIYLDENGLPVSFSDAASMAAYGRFEAVLDLPSAVTPADIDRWALNQLDQKKNPKPLAKAGKFVTDIIKRNIRPEGMTRITADTGDVYQYPIKAVKYALTGAGGINMAMTLGDVPSRIDNYIARILRDARMAELLQQLNNKQLKGVDV
jgi:hypothetical protein